jgi:hypothetical protein
VDSTEALFARLGEVLLADGRRISAQQLVSVAAQVMPHSVHAGITLVRSGREPRTVAASDDLPLRVDRLQYSEREGPCLDAAQGNDLVVSEDLAAESRWPRFGPECARHLGVHSMLSVRLSLAPDNRAALNFYSKSLDAFDDLDAGASSLLAPYAALVVEQELHRSDVTQLEQALSTSRQIGVAVGILMTRHGISAERAFDLLRSSSMHLNRKLRELALDVAATGKLPDEPRSDRR